MPNRITPVVLNLIIINGLVFLGFILLQDNLEIRLFFLKYFPIYKLDLIIQHNPTSADLWHPVQIVTHFFTHFTPTHIILNMFGLFIFGPQLEMFLGGRRFLQMYLIFGLVAGVILTFLDPSPAPVVGASGALFGMMVAMAHYFPHAQFGILFLPFRFRAQQFVRGIALITVGLFVLDTFTDANPLAGISHFGHLAGMAVAYVYLNWKDILRRFQGKR